MIEFIKKILYTMLGVDTMDFNEVITKRFSVRKFINKPIEKEIIDKIIKAGHIAPTGCNFQPQRILVIESEEGISKLKECTRCHFDAPCAMLVCYNKNETWKRPYDEKESAPVDAAIVTTHMMLAATNEGIGTCWVMHFNPEKIKISFEIPDNFVPLALLVMGYPDPSCEPLELHSKKRPLNEIVYYNNFNRKG